MFVADLHASVYVWDISSIKCIWDTCVCVSEICMFIYMRYIWVYVWGMCVSLWCLRSVPKPDTGAEVLIVVVYVWYMSVQIREICLCVIWVDQDSCVVVCRSEWMEAGCTVWWLISVDGVSVATCFSGWCIYGNLFVWMVYPWQLVFVDDVSMATGLCGWCINGNWFVWMVYLCGWCMGGSCCDYLVLLWLCLCNILYQILFDVNNVFNDPDSILPKIGK